MEDDDTTGHVPADLERLIGGTLALMTTWYQCPQPALCHKLMENLALIGRHDAVSDDLRRVCTNAAARWAGYLEEIEAAVEAADGDGEGEDADDDDGPSFVSSPGAGRITLH